MYLIYNETTLTHLPSNNAQKTDWLLSKHTQTYAEGDFKYALLGPRKDGRSA